ERLRLRRGRRNFEPDARVVIGLGRHAGKRKQATFQWTGRNAGELGLAASVEPDTLGFGGMRRRQAMTETLTGLRVAILVTDGFEQVEMTGPLHALEQADATVKIIGEH